MKEYRQQFFKGERALYAEDGACIYDSIFDEGESPLKESKNIEVYDSQFKYKYPIWYSNNVKVERCNWLEMGRSGVWYTNDIYVKDSFITAPKNFRRCDGVTLENVQLTNAEETFWNCKNIKLSNVYAKGSYFAMNSENIEIDGFKLDGNYSFDGAKNITIRNSVLLSKDSFWNTENVTVYDSYICGEYLGWNSKNLKFVNCTIESLQGFCYIDNLEMENCKLINTTLAFEYVDNVNANITTKIDSVFNPISGTITAPEIEHLIVEPDLVDPSKTVINCKQIGKTEEIVEWRRDRK
ncbi:MULTISPECIES: DUF3737 family protein [Pseudobutyrivibrio]|uniref:Pentapeptide repeat-containing protein n=2 Tax=Bacteria TaxID=2 RepID=A0A1M6FV49_PSEXY|nr:MULTISPECIES: DUF3737 family protein [Pseudobutyrivibrio]MDC7280558.1 DUF3737 family protein [Butyrivibrio fibrisolvens]SDI07360.1 Protein of unknown function [Pseudobutyrivibrio sp. 49]SFO10412.1 Protein of unknown function [Pseudobutyrivibrio sp. UC1225]SHJ01553.1 Protein of unknown function [Pseudobutyrivibrio xylanivorans DSM 14809]